MTDHGPGSTSHEDEVGDDDYRLGVGTPPRDAEPHPTPDSATHPAPAGGPPPQVSGLPGWAAPHSPVEAPTAQIPRQAESEQPVPELSATELSATELSVSELSVSEQSAVEPVAAEALVGEPVAAQSGAYGHAQPTAAYAVSGWPERELPTLPPLPEAAPTSGRPFQHATPPRKRLGRGALAGIVAGGVALATVLVTAVVLTFDDGGGTGISGGGDGTDVPALSAGWTLPGSASDHQVGTWVTGPYLVRGTQSGVKAYRLTDGTAAWTAAPLTGPGVPCAMSPTVSASGVGTIGFGPDTSTCTTLVGVDTRTGKTLWSTALTTKDHSDASAATTFIDGNVGVVVNATVLGGVDLTDGHVVWGYKPRGQYCNAYPYGGAGTVLVDDYCVDVGGTYMVTALDAATGKQLWQKQSIDHVQFGTILNGSPVVATLSGGSGTANLYDAHGNATPLATKGRLDPALASADSSGSAVREVAGSTLVLPVRDLTQAKASLSAVSLTSGAASWTYDGETHLGAVLARGQADGGSSKLYAISLAHAYGDDANPELVSLDPTTGAATVLAKLPATPASPVYTTGTVYVLPDGRVLLIGLDDSGTAVRLFK